MCLLAAALGFLFCAACAEQKLAPGMMMSARVSYFEPDDYLTNYGFVPGEPKNEDGGGRASRGQVASITFRSSLAGAPEDAWDMSEDGDGSVLSWFRDGTLTIIGISPILDRSVFGLYPFRLSVYSGSASSRASICWSSSASSMS